ncbi:MAG: YmdB family metallophosphoesterase [Planctomycetales bacterium]|nr:YmdB family metallophosphoesterase [Planctomycetales bacterium]MCA9169949.1 YmdB family metallophosphoesterase [Planctomycetales bacterium]
MRILHIGDIVGKPGRQIVLDRIPRLREERGIDLVIANAENIAGGSGITPKLYRDLLCAGVDCITLGDHIYRRREIYTILEADEPIVKPANYPGDAPGKSWTVVTAKNGAEVAVFSLLGRVFMRPVDCPWAAADRVLAEIPESIKVRWLDFHAEATSDKQCMGRYLAGRVTAVIGTHTHVPTADEEIMSGGTAFQCDVGMTGPHSGILGRRADRVMETTVSFRPMQFDVATGDVRLNAACVEVDETTGRALTIQRVCLRDSDT